MTNMLRTAEPRRGPALVRRRHVARDDRGPPSLPVIMKLCFPFFPYFSPFLLYPLLRPLVQPLALTAPGHVTAGGRVRRAPPDRGRTDGGGRGRGWRGLSQVSPHTYYPPSYASRYRTVPARAPAPLKRPSEIGRGSSRGSAARASASPSARSRSATLRSRRGADAPPLPRTNWTRRVPHPVLIGHAVGRRRCVRGAVRTLAPWTRFPCVSPLAL